MTDKPIDSFEIFNSLRSEQLDRCRYLMQNVFVYKWNWESDLFVLKDSGFSWEFEIKVSRNDFRKDFTKLAKHRTLREAFDKKLREAFSAKTKNGAMCPNKFFYVAPKGMIRADELPEYAGLVEYERGLGCQTKRDAPTIHREVYDFDRIMVKKFYHRWLNTEARFRESDRMVMYLNEKKRNDPEATE